MENPPSDPFWTYKSLEAMTETEWESLCDRCGRCCLVKLEDEDTGTIHFTDVACKLFSSGSCQCEDYANRQKIVNDCIRLTPQQVRSITWLPPTCGYKLVRDGEPLMWWHPLVSGSHETVHEAGVSVRGQISAFEDDIPVEDLLDHLVKWPNRIPKSARKKPEPKKS